MNDENGAWKTASTDRVRVRTDYMATNRVSSRHSECAESEQVILYRNSLCCGVIAECPYFENISVHFSFFLFFSV